MIESGFKRAFFALGIFLAGLHLVGFGIWNNGNASTNNPTWVFIQNVWAIEILFLKIIFGCFFVYVLMAILKILATNDETKKSISETENTPKTIEPSNFPAHPNIVVRTEKLQIHSEPVIKPDPISAEELKRRALKQITGKEF